MHFLHDVPYFPQRAWRGMRFSYGLCPKIVAVLSQSFIVRFSKIFELFKIEEEFQSCSRLRAGCSWLRARFGLRNLSFSIC